MCRGLVMLCVSCNLNANNACENACPGNSFLMSPCLSNNFTCPYSNTASSSSIQLTVGTKILYPTFNTALEVVPARNSLTVMVNVSLPGVIYCAAFAPGTAITPSSVSNAGFSALSEASNIYVSVTVTGLAPESPYDVYCYSQDYQSHNMPLAVVQASRVVTNTLCCRSIIISSTVNEITAYDANNTVSVASTPVFFSFHIDTSPTAAMNVSVILTAVPCRTGFVQTIAPVIAPNMFTYTPATRDLSNRFIIRGREGCYQLNITVISGVNTYTPASIPLLTIRSLDEPPSPPKLSSALFTSDGRLVIVDLDSATNQARTVLTNFAGSFQCSLLLSFNGSTGSTCLWLSNKQIQISQGTPTVGMNVTLLPNTVYPACPSGVDCSAYNTNSNSSIASILAPTNPIAPVVSISTPRSIGGCSDIVLDPTLSTGNGGRPWSSVLWTLEGVGLLSEIGTLLQQYTDTNSIIRIPNALLERGDIIFTLRLTNFLGGVALRSARVTILANDAVPTVSIVGSATLITYRNLPINVVASASIPSCGGEVNKALTYSWKVFNGLQYLSQIISVSSDPRNFKLNAFRLNASTEYALQVTVALASDSTITSTASINIRVLSSGVLAVIQGGNSRSVSSTEVYSIDASGSYDIDYPLAHGNRPLSYSWTCIETTPSYGAACGLTFPNQATLVFANNFILDIGKTYFFTVYAANADGASSSASTTIAVISTELPTVTVGSVNPKYNVNDKIVLLATVSGRFSMNTTWGSSDVNVQNVALNTYSRVLNPGIFGLELPLRANSFTAGLSYTFSLLAFYPQATGKRPSPSLITIVMNAPPVGGVLTITPVEGFALNTSFFLQTAQWSDDPLDYPLSYLISYYTTDPTKQTVVKNIGSQSYAANVLMGQGVESSGFMVTCFVSAADTYGAAGSTTTMVKVEPMADRAALAAAVNNQLGSAFETGDSGLVSQVIGAATAALNSANCTAAPNCTALNRQACKSTSNTCSVCFAGFLGDKGDANTRCNNPALVQLGRNGATCTVSDDCVSNNCLQGTCQLPSKTCPVGPNGLPCSGPESGSCAFMKNTGEVITSCTLGNSLCEAVCVCHGVASCSLTPDAFEQLKRLREQMCVSIYRTLDMQDVTEDVVVSRANSIADVLLNIDQVTMYALTNCTEALAITVIRAAAIDPYFIAGNEVTSTTISKSLSAVLAVGSIGSQLLNLVATAIDAQNSAIQELLAVGEDAACTATDNLNVCASKSYSDDLTDQSFAPAQSDLDKFNNVPVTTINMQPASLGRRRLQLGEAVVVGVTVVQQPSNPRGAPTNSTSVILATTSTSDDEMNTTLVLINNEPITYIVIPSYTGNFTCNVTGSPYTDYIPCPSGPIEVTCNGTEASVGEYECPTFESKPECVHWDDSARAFVPNPDCTLVSYSAYNTTCTCIVRPVNRMRRQLADTSEDGLIMHHPNSPRYHDIKHRIYRERRFQAKVWSEDAFEYAFQTTQHRYLGTSSSELASQATLLTTQFASRWRSISSVDLSTIKKNIVVFMTCLGLLCCTIGGLFYFLCVDAREIRVAKRKEEAGKEEKKFRRVYDFFSLILPDEFSPEPWLARLWKKILVEHDYFCCIMPYNKDRSMRSLKWVVGMGKILNFLFIDTILAGLFFDDGGRCATYAARTDCLQTPSLDQYNSLCAWTETVPGSGSDTAGTCSFEGPPDNDVLSQIICTMVITILAVPLDKLIERSLDDLKVYVDALKVRISGDIHSVEDLKNQELGDELKDVQSLQNTIMRAARFTKMVNEMDNVSPEGEIDLMIQNHESLVSRACTKTSASMKVARRKGLSFANFDDALADKEVYQAYVDSKHGNRKRMVKKIVRARKDADYIKQQLSLIDGEDSREIYLLQQFLCSTLKGVRKYIANRIFFEHLETEEEKSSKSLRRIYTLIFIPLYFAVLSLYIFLFGVSIGPKSTRFWLIASMQSFAMDIFLLQPCKIWMQKIGVTAAAGIPMQKLHAVLRDRSVTIMKRTSGLMRYSSAFVQHLNPACRAARFYPELPAARLLMSLSDFDLPLEKFNKKTGCMSVLSDVAGLIGIGIMFTLVLLPEFIQETTIEITVSGVVNFAVLVAYYLSLIQIALPGGIVVGGFIIAYYYYRRSVRKRREEEDTAMQILEQKVVLFVRRNWKSPLNVPVMTGKPGILSRIMSFTGPGKKTATVVPVAEPLNDLHYPSEVTRKKTARVSPGLNAK